MSTQELLRQSAPAEPWFAVWVAAYTVIRHPVRPDTLAASWLRLPPLRIRALPAGS